MFLVLFDDPYTTTSTQPAGTRLEHSGGIFGRPHASTGFDFHSVAVGTFICQIVACSTHQPDVFDSCAVSEEACRGFYEIEVGGRGNGTSGDHFPGAELRGLEDEFEDGRLWGHGADQSEFVVDFAVLLLLELRPVDDDVKFVCTGSQGHPSLLQLVVCVLGALVEADYAGDQDLASFEVGVRLGDIVGPYADALERTLSAP